MSLKAFHIVFVIVAMALALGFGVWAIREYRLRGGTDTLIWGIASLLLVPVLIWYGRWFLRKHKGISYL